MKFLTSKTYSDPWKVINRFTHQIQLPFLCIYHLLPVNPENRTHSIHSGHSPLFFSVYL